MTAADYWQWLQLASSLLVIVVVNFVILHDETIMVAFVVIDAPAELQRKVIGSATAAAIVIRLAMGLLAFYVVGGGELRKFGESLKIMSGSAVIGVALFIGIKRLWIAWTAYRELNRRRIHRTGFVRLFLRVLFTEITNAAELVALLAVASQGSVVLLIAGLTLSIICKTFATMRLVELLQQYAWLSWIGIIVVLWYGLTLVYEGSHEVSCETYNFGCTESIFEAVLHRLGWGA
jgi:predicted tellurium resistance membrane protein TerC